jgi:putative DNA primase/helicase
MAGSRGEKARRPHAVRRPTNFFPETEHQLSKRKRSNEAEDMALAPTETACVLDDPREIQDAEDAEESGGDWTGDEDCADAEAVSNRRCGLSSSDVADRLITENADEFRFLSDRGVVFSFRDGIWSADTGDKHALTHELFRAARRLCARVYEESGAPSHVKAHLKSAYFPKAVVSIAVTELKHIRFADCFDVNPDLLGIPGGRVVELRTGTVRDAKPGDYVSKAATVAPDSATRPTRFLQFLDEIAKRDVSLAQYLLRLMGYFLTGHITQDYLGFWTGVASNGKSILCNLLTRTLGDYVVTISVKLLSAGLNEDSEQEMRTMAHLCGARVAFASESSKRLKIDIGLAKKLASPEKLLGRFLRENAFSFSPSHKLVISAQELQFESVDFAIQRRLHVTPFRQVFAQPRDMARFPDAMPADLQLGSKLDRERPGILALLIDEAGKWYADGLAVPRIVAETTDTYFADADDFGQWLEQNCIREAEAFTPTNVLFANYGGFSQQMGIEPTKQDVFAKKLKASGFKDERGRVDGRQLRGYVGLRLKSETEQ